LIKLLLKIVIRFIFHKDSNATLGFVRKTFFLAVFGLASSIFSIIIIESLGNGYKKNLKSKFVELDGHIEISKKNNSPIELDVSNNIARFLKSQNLSYDYQFQSRSYAVARAGDYAEGVIASSIIKGEKNSFENFFSLRDVFLSSSNQIILGKNIGQNLNVSIGDSVFLFNIDSFNPSRPVIGKIINPKIINTFSFGINDLDNHFIQLDTVSYKHLFGHLNVSLIKFNLIDRSNQILVKKKLLNEFGDDFQIITSDDRYAGLYKSLDDIFDSIFLIVFFLILICLLNIVSSSSLIVESKKNQIKLLMLMGMSFSNIFLIFLMIAMMSSLISFFIGFLLAIFVVLIQNKYQFFQITSDVYLISNLTGSIDFYYALHLFGLLILSTFLSCSLFFIASSLGRRLRLNV
tara:strand:+ start:1974 stop:3188 length:1215 start_codon:yes stop_codon:yes gene_type:complete